MANVQIKGVTKRYEEKTVLSSFDLELKDGECFTLLGPSGCGKTVLMRLIAGFEKADAGVISIDGTVVTNPADGTMISPDKRALGMVFQDYAVWPHMTVFDNIAYPLKLAGVEAGELKTRTMRAVELVGLKGMDQRFPSMLINGPFSILVGFTGGMMALNDRLKLRSMVVAETEDMAYVASEECAIRRIAPDVTNVWAPRGGQPVIFTTEGGRA